VSGASGLRKHGHTSAGDGGTITVPGGDAVDVTYDNSGSGLAATDVQAAIDEIDGTVDGFGSAVDISDDGANVQGVNFEDQGSNPATPAAGHTIAFTMSDGLYDKDDAGAVTGPMGTGGGSPVEAKDEGSSLTATLASIDFTGSGVTATTVGDDVTVDIPGSGVTEITDLPTAETDTSLVLAPDGAGGVEFRAETGGSGTAGTAILLTYDLASDVSNQAITGGTFFDVFANQNFTVASATSIVEVAVRGFGFFNDNATNNQYLTRINIDSAGTPVLRYLSGDNDTHPTLNSRHNPLVGGSLFISGLSAATHTIKLQITAIGNDHFYCRASSNGPTTGGEFLTVQVIEHKNASGGVITTADGGATSNVSVSAATYTDICSVSLAAGTWDIWAWLNTNGNSTNPGTSYDTYAQLWDGSAQLAQTVGWTVKYGAGPDNVPYVIVPVFAGSIVLGSTTTIKLRCYCDVATAALGSTGLGTGGGSRIHAMKIA
jgi:hypothetical protein